MSSFPKLLEELIQKLSRFPGIGRRSAERIAFHILKMDQKETSSLVSTLSEINQKIKPCSVCNNFSLEDKCSICSNPKRETDTVCIVEEPKDVLAVEKTSFNGLYYVLLGSISPLEGLGPENLNIGKLLNRLQKGEVREVIIATDPDTEGELTAQFLIEKISKFNVKIYRISIGIPLGTQIEYIDSATLGKAILEKKSV